MSHDNRSYYMRQRPTNQDNESTFSGVTYEPNDISYLELILSNPYKLWFYFLLGMCAYLLFFR